MVKMYQCFEFESGGNPYIATTGETFLKMIRKYNYEVQKDGFLLTTSERKSRISYKDVIKEFYYKLIIDGINPLRDWEYYDFFKVYCKKYGLMRWFKEKSKQIF